MHRVFAYGTLKRGLKNHHLMARARFLGLAASVPHYRMIAGDYPVLFEQGAGLLPVSGELFEVDDATLVELDKLESVGTLYDRKTVAIALGDAGVTDAFIYIGRPAAWASRGWLPFTARDADGRLHWPAPAG
ncbi:protein of unknown function UPF0131 [Rhodopseudomonas palustris BisB18]|uniref:Gamma-glutamylcyclotransferase family protein n=2 Tax=Rhodopseudomonas palustris TaxID=1076 RepID=Q20ZZ6_RHOPB